MTDVWSATLLYCAVVWFVGVVECLDGRCGSDTLVILGFVRRGAPVRLDAGHGGRRAGCRVMTS